MLTILLTVLAVVLAGLAAFAARKPDTFRVARSVRIDAPPEAVFLLINDLRNQSRWSPFEKDPHMKKVHSGPPQGRGAAFEWEGNREVGQGRIAITDSTPPSRVVLALDMAKPMVAHNIVEFTLRPQGASTEVTWSMHGPQPFMAKLMSVFIDCERMVGSQFDEGLGKLKAIAESRTALSS